MTTFFLYLDQHKLFQNSFFILGHISKCPWIPLKVIHPISITAHTFVSAYLETFADNKSCGVLF